MLMRRLLVVALMIAMLWSTAQTTVLANTAATDPPLTITQAGAGGNVLPGQNLAITVSVAANQPVQVNSATVVSSGLEVVSATTTSGSCTVGASIVCALNLATTSSAAISIQLRVRATASNTPLEIYSVAEDSRAYTAASGRLMFTLLVPTAVPAPPTAVPNLPAVPQQPPLSLESRPTVIPYTPTPIAEPGRTTSVPGNVSEQSMPATSAAEQPAQASAPAQAVSAAPVADARFSQPQAPGAAVAPENGQPMGADVQEQGVLQPERAPAIIPEVIQGIEATAPQLNSNPDPVIAQLEQPAVPPVGVPPVVDVPAQLPGDPLPEGLSASIHPAAPATLSGRPVTARDAAALLPATATGGSVIGLGFGLIGMLLCVVAVRRIRATALVLAEQERARPLIPLLHAARYMQQRTAELMQPPEALHSPGKETSDGR